MIHGRWDSFGKAVLDMNAGTNQPFTIATAITSEMAEGIANGLKRADYAVSLIREILGDPGSDRYGYFAASRVLNDDLRERMRALEALA